MVGVVVGGVRFAIVLLPLTGLNTMNRNQNGPTWKIMLTIAVMPITSSSTATIRV
jgi:hypothetical protein